MDPSQCSVIYYTYKYQSYCVYVWNANNGECICTNNDLEYRHCCEQSSYVQKYEFYRKKKLMNMKLNSKYGDAN